MNLLDECMNKICSNNPSELNDINKNVDSFVKNDADSNLNCVDLIKFCEATLMFVKNGRAVNEMQGLIVIQLFVQRLTESMNIHSYEILKQLIENFIGFDEQINQSAKKIIIFMMKQYTPKFVWNKLSYGLGLESNIREDVKNFLLDLLNDTIAEYGINSINRDTIENCLINLKNESEKTLLIEKSNKLLSLFNEQTNLDKQIHDELNDKILRLNKEIKELKDNINKLERENNEYKNSLTRLNKINEAIIKITHDNIISKNNNNTETINNVNNFDFQDNDNDDCFYEDEEEAKIQNLINGNDEDEAFGYEEISNHEENFDSCNNKNKSMNELEDETDLTLISSNQIQNDNETVNDEFSDNASDNLYIDYDDENGNQNDLNNTGPSKKKFRTERVVIKASEYVLLTNDFIDCKDCNNSEEYSLLFRTKLNELLGSKWSRTKDQLTKDQSHLKYYYVCNKYYQATLKCKSKCIVDINLETKMATIMHNSQLHNHV